MNDVICLFSLIYDKQFMPFAFGCAITSILFLMVDYAYYHAEGKLESLLGITYRGNHILILGATWFIGALIVGYFSVFIGLMNMSNQSMFTLGILWPVALSKMITSAKGQLAAQDEEEAEEVDENDGFEDTEIDEADEDDKIEDADKGE